MWREVLHVTIPGEPVGKGRPRFTKRGHAYTPKKTKHWESQAALLMSAAWAGDPLDEPLRVVIKALRSQVKGRRTWAYTKPDADNYCKAAGDALEAARVVVNDSRIVHIECLKRHAVDNEQPCVIVAVYTLENPRS